MTWICRTRSSNGLFASESRVTTGVRRIARVLTDLSKTLWPGSVRALQMNALPAVELPNIRLTKALYQSVRRSPSSTGHHDVSINAAQDYFVIAGSFGPVLRFSGSPKTGWGIRSRTSATPDALASRIEVCMCIQCGDIFESPWFHPKRCNPHDSVCSIGGAP